MLDWQATSGRCRVLPNLAEVLVLVNEEGAERAFGFGLYPEFLNDSAGRPLLTIPVAGRWYFSDSIKSADPRYRNIVQRFAAAGYLEAESEGLAQLKNPTGDEPMGRSEKQRGSTALRRSGRTAPLR